MCISFEKGLTATACMKVRGEGAAPPVRLPAGRRSLENYCRVLKREQPRESEACLILDAVYSITLRFCVMAT